MYRFDKPIRRNSYKDLSVIILVVLAIVAGLYFVFVQKPQNSTTIKNSPPVTTKISSNAGPSVTINEPLFSMVLPGSWRETARNHDPRYQSIQWNDTGAQTANRWIRIYIDSIPPDFAINYLQPVIAYNGGLKVGQISENCVTFTQGATPNTSRDVSVPQSQAALPARWQGFSFTCDNSHVSHQVVGTGSAEGSDAVTVNGPQHGPHKYFFVYEDDNFHPDYSILKNILTSFRAK